MKYKLLLFITIVSGFSFFLLHGGDSTDGLASGVIDASRDGAVFGDEAGLKRVKALEEQLHQLQIREDHPRIFITKENIPKIKSKLNAFNPYWQEILNKAYAGDLLNSAFVYALLKDSDPLAAQLALNTVKKILFETEFTNIKKNKTQQREAALMALAFDWIYQGLTDQERNDLIKKLSRLNNIEQRAHKIRSEHKEIGETFHREEWVFNSWRGWPEIALAGHVKEAEFNYKSRWNYNWYLGDAARMYAYAADGTPFEGYYMGADGCDWFLALKTATGINLIDDQQLGWCRNAAYYVLYRMDFGLGREIFHKGAFNGHAGILSYSNGTSGWKFLEFLGRNMGLASDDPYCKWIINNISNGISSWTITTTGYSGLAELKDIANVIYDNPMQKAKNPQTASYEELPFARLFLGGKEAVMRTSFRPQSTCVGFTAKNAYTMTSHSDFDVNTFMIYKQGNLSADSGTYDVYRGQKNYFKYQKNTVAHNNILIVDPSNPDEPRKLAKAPDPGGIDLVNNRTFGAVTRFGLKDAFIHDPQANWSKILDFKTTKEFEYIISDATKAYASRLNEYVRHLIFIPKIDNAYIIVFDRIEAKDKNFIKKWLLHLVTEPSMDGELLQTKIPKHYEIYDSNFLVAANVFHTARLYNKALLPRNKTVSKIGGDGFEFFVEGSAPKNWSISQGQKQGIEGNTGGPWQEVGTWRIEVTATDKNKRDYFLNVLYATDISDILDPKNISLEENDNEVKVLIKDPKLGDIYVSMKKTGQPQINIYKDTNEPNTSAKNHPQI